MTEDAETIIEDIDTDAATDTEEQTADEAVAVLRQELAEARGQLQALQDAEANRPQPVDVGRIIAEPSADSIGNLAPDAARRVLSELSTAEAIRWAQDGHGELLVRLGERAAKP